jgi:hypothetical protein
VNSPTKVSVSSSFTLEVQRFCWGLNDRPLDLRQLNLDLLPLVLYEFNNYDGKREEFDGPGSVP